MGSRTLDAAFLTAAVIALVAFGLLMILGRGLPVTSAATATPSAGVTFSAPPSTVVTTEAPATATQAVATATRVTTAPVPTTSAPTPTPAPRTATPVPLPSATH